MEHIHYLADPGLESALKVALELEMPLLITGEPGTGKTQAAYWAAKALTYESADGQSDIPLQTKVLRFNTKTTSVAKDLFYRYDAIRHFRASRGEQPQAVSALQFVSLEALGKAILAGAPYRRYVVLVDEIDKAPRDFPNDVLFEFEEMAFRIEEADAKDFAELPEHFWQEKLELAELGVALENVVLEQSVLQLAKGAPKPLLILTSNSEKNLPDAFLRRCVFYHIPFPEEEERLAEIVSANVQLSPKYEKMLGAIIREFLDIRKKGLRKLPATAELVRWVEILAKRKIDLEKANGGDTDMKKKLLTTYPVLAKNREDLAKLSS